MAGAGIKQTAAQTKEILLCGKDPVYFIKKYIFIQHPQRGTIKFDTYPFQDDCIKAFIENRFCVVLKSRQLGLSTLAAAYSVWMAVFRRDKNILVIATKLSVAQNFIRKVKAAINHLPKWLMLPTVISNNKQQVEFSNGSQIKAVPTSPDAGRSEALSLVIVDEAAFIRDFDTIWTAMYSTLSTGGRAIVLSTPNGVGDKYHEIYSKAEAGENEFLPIKLPWTVHPERDQKWFDNESKNMSPKQVAQELLCSFVSSGNTFVDADILNDLSYGTVEPVEKSGPGSGLWYWKYPTTGGEYIIAADVARGDAADFSAFHVIDKNESEIVAEFKGKLRPDQFGELLYDTGTRYNNALVCPESNTFGFATIMKMHDKGYTNFYYKDQADKFEAVYSGATKVHKIGFSTQGQSRQQIITKLEEVLRNKKIKINSTRLVAELKTLVNAGGRVEAMKSKNDDLIMALAIGVWIFDPHSKAGPSNSALSNAILSAFKINKTPTADEINRQWNMSTTDNFDPNISRDQGFIGSANAYNRGTQGDFYKQFPWLFGK
jgi:hypothetical protein